MQAHQVIICPNPDCHAKIEESILLSKMSPAEQYYACPRCFTKLDVIFTQPEKKEDLVKPPENEKKGPSRCTGYLGYLASRPKSTPVPQECLVCPKVLDCVMKKE